MPQRVARYRWAISLFLAPYRNMPDENKSSTNGNGTLAAVFALFVQQLPAAITYLVTTSEDTGDFGPRGKAYLALTFIGMLVTAIAGLIAVVQTGIIWCCAPNWTKEARIFSEQLAPWFNSGLIVFAGLLFAVADGLLASKAGQDGDGSTHAA